MSMEFPDRRRSLIEKPLKFENRESLDSVSYTHLPVVSSSALSPSVSPFSSSQSSGSSSSDTSSSSSLSAISAASQPVSYTHLDVYKRQDSGWTYLSGARSVTVYVPAWRLSTRMLPSGPVTTSFSIPFPEI